MNKKGGLQTFLTSNFIFAIIFLIVFLFVLGSGGASALINIGNLLSKIPAWFYIAIALLWFVKVILGGK